MEFLTDLLALISLGHILEDPTRVESPAYIYLGAVLAVLGIIGLLLAQRPRLLSRENALHQRIIATYGGWLGWLSAFGVVAVIVRYANAPFFSKRLWLAIDVLGILGLAGHLAWYRVKRYQVDLASYIELQRHQRLRPVVQPRPRRASAARRRR
ncbi:MAG: hypothetical protein EXR58_03125 [Chloroflexi bacterium]|nr:hypothetical protein [Chloroflexota bacterium]